MKDAPTQTPHAHDRDREAIEAIVDGLMQIDDLSSGPEMRGISAEVLAALRARGWTSPTDAVTEEETLEAYKSLGASEAWKRLAYPDDFVAVRNALQAARLAAGKVKP